MFRPFPVLFGVTALVLLTCYFFDGVSLMPRPEPLPWSEFSTNEWAVAHFRQAAELKGQPIGPKEADLKKAYDAVYVAQVKAYREAEYEQSSSSASVLKRSWRAVYRFCYPGLRSTRQGLIHPVSEAAQERVGMFVTLLALGAALAAVQAALRRVERQTGV